MVAKYSKKSLILIRFKKNTLIFDAKTSSKKFYLNCILDTHNGDRPKHVNNFEILILCGLIDIQFIIIN